MRTRVLKQVLQDKLSVAQSRKLVAVEIANHTKQPDASLGKKQVDAMIRQVREIPLQKVERTQLAQLREVFQQKLMEIELALKQDSVNE
ncbi:MAG: hypothetical protein F6K28_53430 [Microcoleus sp. SIO2G3]|nr:hypothetical protein [Microcoleus sp. SIO2G3]